MKHLLLYFALLIVGCVAYDYTNEHTTTLDCFDRDVGRHYKNKEVYRPNIWYNSCAICQCLDGKIVCLSICDPQFAGRAWVVPLITGGVALLISMIFSLSLFCCMKFGCKAKQIRTPQPSPVQDKQLMSYFVIPGPEEKAHLISY